MNADSRPCVRSPRVAINAVVGFAGLGVTVAALRARRRLALANKESLIAGAPVVQAARATEGAEIVPVDSEHCAIHQCLGERRSLRIDSADGPEPPPDVRRLVLTASGGPFRGRRRAELSSVGVDDRSPIRRGRWDRRSPSTPRRS